MQDFFTQLNTNTQKPVNTHSIFSSVNKGSTRTEQAPTLPEPPKGWNFSASLGNNAKETQMGKILTQSAKQQITFAQKILLQQLKHQFPGNEFDANKMVESLMGMMQIAQHSQLNETQAESLTLNKALINHQLAQLQGKIVEHRSDTFDYKGGEQSLSYSLPQEAQEATLYIYKEGESIPVFEESIDSTPGTHMFTWQGILNTQEAAPKGIYNIFVRAKDSNKQDLPVDLRIHSEITDIDYNQGTLGIPYSGSIPLFNFNKMVSPYKSVLNTQIMPHLTTIPVSDDF